jgi:predicted permease
MKFPWSRRKRKDELDEEIQNHLQRAARARIERGETPSEAERFARLEFGNIGLVTEITRDMWGWRWLEDLILDICFGARMLLRSPGFTAVAVLTLALGVGANATIFSVIDAVVFKSLPFREPNRLAIVWNIDQKDPTALSPISSADFVEWKDQVSVFEQIAGWRFLYFNVTGRDAPERAQGLSVSASFLPLLGAEAQLGRTFLSEEEQPGHERVTVLSDTLWRRRFGADPNLVGQKIKIDGGPYTVVGILSPTFRIFQVLNRPLDIYVPLTLDPSHLNRQEHDMFVYVRLKPGVSLDRAQSEMVVLYRRLEREYPGTNKSRSARVISMPEAFAGDVRPALLLLFSTVGFVLLIACANLANLILARATVRGKEMAVRAALGAGRARLLRQVLAETLLLGLLGGATGILLAFWGIRVLNDAIPQQAVKRLYDFQLDVRVLGFTLVLSLLSSILFGLVPALRSAGSSLVPAFQESGRGWTGGVRVRRMSGWLMISEMALATALLGGAVLSIRSSLFLQTIPRGLNPAHVLTMQVWLPRTKYHNGRSVVAFFHEVLQRIHTLPEVESASAVNFPPLALQYLTVRFAIEGSAPSSRYEMPNARCSIISPEYFRTMEIPLLSGRVFNDSDADEAHGVAVISASMASRFGPNQDPIGHQIRPQFTQQKYFWIPESKNLPLTIVGVVGDVRQDGLAESNLPQFYLPYQQNPSSIMNLVVRTPSDPMRWANAVQTQVWAVDKDEPVFDIKTVADVAAESFARPHVLAFLFGTFAFLALTLAAVGIYGLISYSVSQRTQEVGIRVALGAQQGDILRLIVGQGLRLTAAGLVIGTAISLAFTRLLTGLLFGVKPTDPITLGAVALLLAFVALAACYIPARRAMRVDPMVALRYE